MPTAPQGVHASTNARAQHIFNIDASKRTGSCPFYNLKNRGKQQKKTKELHQKKCHFFKPKTKQTSTHPHTHTHTSKNETFQNCFFRFCICCDICICPLPLLFAAFGAGSCHFNCVCVQHCATFCSSNFSFSMEFATSLLFFPTFWGWKLPAVSTVCALFLNSNPSFSMQFATFVARTLRVTLYFVTKVHVAMVQGLIQRFCLVLMSVVGLRFIFDSFKSQLNIFRVCSRFCLIFV